MDVKKAEQFQAEFDSKFKELEKGEQKKITTLNKKLQTLMKKENESIQEERERIATLGETLEESKKVMVHGLYNIWLNCQYEKGELPFKVRMATYVVQYGKAHRQGWLPNEYVSISEGARIYTARKDNKTPKPKNKRNAIYTFEQTPKGKRRIQFYAEVEKLAKKCGQYHLPYGTDTDKSNLVSFLAIFGVDLTPITNVKPEEEQDETKEEDQ